MVWVWTQQRPWAWWIGQASICCLVCVSLLKDSCYNSLPHKWSITSSLAVWPNLHGQYSHHLYSYMLSPPILFAWSNPNYILFLATKTAHLKLRLRVGTKFGKFSWGKKLMEFEDQFLSLLFLKPKTIGREKATTFYHKPHKNKSDTWGFKPFRVWISSKIRKAID